MKFSGREAHRDRRAVCRDQGADRRLLDDQGEIEEEAIAWAKRAPNPPANGQEGEIEIRQLFEMEDFAPSEAVDRAKELGKELAKTKKQSQ